MWTKLFNRSSTLGSTISSAPLKNLIFRKMVTPEVLGLSLHDTPYCQGDLQFTYNKKFQQVDFETAVLESNGQLLTNDTVVFQS